MLKRKNNIYVEENRNRAFLLELLVSQICLLLPLEATQTAELRRVCNRYCHFSLFGKCRKKLILCYHQKNLPLRDGIQIQKRWMSVKNNLSLVYWVTSGINLTTLSRQKFLNLSCQMSPNENSFHALLNCGILSEYLPQ